MAHDEEVLKRINREREAMGKPPVDKDGNYIPAGAGIPVAPTFLGKIGSEDCVPVAATPGPICVGYGIFEDANAGNFPTIGEWSAEDNAHGQIELGNFYNTLEEAERALGAKVLEFLDGKDEVEIGCDSDGILIRFPKQSSPEDATEPLGWYGRYEDPEKLMNAFASVLKHLGVKTSFMEL